MSEPDNVFILPSFTINIAVNIDEDYSQSSIFADWVMKKECSFFDADRQDSSILSRVCKAQHNLAIVQL